MPDLRAVGLHFEDRYPGLQIHRIMTGPFEGFRVGWKHEESYGIDSRTTPEGSVEELQEAVEKVRKKAFESFGFNEDLTTHLDRNDARWKRELEGLLLATGMSPAVVDHLAKKIAEKIKEMR